MPGSDASIADADAGTEVQLMVKSDGDWETVAEAETDEGVIEQWLRGHALITGNEQRTTDSPTLQQSLDPLQVLIVAEGDLDPSFPCIGLLHGYASTEHVR